MKLTFNQNALSLLEAKNLPDVLSVKDAQAILGICRISVYKLIDSHQLQAFRIGRTYMIPKSALREFLSYK